MFAFNAKTYGIDVESHQLFAKCEHSSAIHLIFIIRIPRVCCAMHSARIGRVFPGGCSGGVTPVPIPNTVAKPSSADGTGNGRVGRRRGLFQKASLRLK